MLGMFFETKYGKIVNTFCIIRIMLGMFFETKYGKIKLKIIGI